MQTLVVSNTPEAWDFLTPAATVIDATDYLLSDQFQSQCLRIINLCDNYNHQSLGYYVSLLAHAKGHKAIPSIDNIQDCLNTRCLQYIPPDLDAEMQLALKKIKGEEFIFSLYFGHNMAKCHEHFAKCLYGFFPLPLIRFHFEYKKNWKIRSIKPLSLDDIPPHHLDFMQQSAKAFLSKKRFHQWRKKRHYYNLAILVDPKEPNAPSNPKALEIFSNIGESLGLNVDYIEKGDAKTLSDYDALFIRATTSVNHYTYRLARRALESNMVVIDDPQSIVRCTNKVYLAELLRSHQILTPETVFISKFDKELPAITFPCVLKKPDSSFSHGVVKIDDRQSLQKSLNQFFKTSDLVLTQSFIPTEYDWRIGIFDNKVIYACRYYMAKDHWQIFNWDAQTGRQEGGHETLPIHTVPEAILKLALKGTRLIGDGLYGVDIKTYGDMHYIIEINDNPNIDFGIEDQVEGEALYHKIMTVFLERIQKKNDKARV